MATVIRCDNCGRTSEPEDYKGFLTIYEGDGPKGGAFFGQFCVPCARVALAGDRIEDTQRRIAEAAAHPTVKNMAWQKKDKDPNWRALWRALLGVREWDFSEGRAS